MDRHTAEVFASQVIFDLTLVSMAPHLRDNMPLSVFGLEQGLIPELSMRLGISSDSITRNMTFGELAERVERESPLDVHIEKVSILEFLFG